MPTPNPNLKNFWATGEINNQPVRFRILYGGRDSSKSWDAATQIMFLAYKYQIRVLCTRMFQNRIDDSVYTTIKKQANRFNLESYFEFQRSRILTDVGSEFLFYGLSRNIEEIKSTEGINVLWIEEGQSLTEGMWDVLEPTIRQERSEIWIVFNPDYETDFVWQRFIENPPDNALTRKINFDENPFLSDTSKQTIERRKKEDYQSYEHIYLGVPKEDDEAVIIKKKWIEAAVDAHDVLDIDVSGIKRIGYDPADGNEEGTADNNATCKRHGILVEDTTQWQAGEDELYQSSERVYRQAVGQYEVVYDSIGVGAGVGSNLTKIASDSGNSIEYDSFNAGGKVFNPDKEYKDEKINKNQFKNIKAQAWWNVADRFRLTYNAVKKGLDVDKSKIISISSECDNLSELIRELSAPKRDYDGAERVKVESKKDMKKRGIDSPNLADALIMAFAPKKKTNILTSAMV